MSGGPGSRRIYSGGWTYGGVAWASHERVDASRQGPGFTLPGHRNAWLAFWVPSLASEQQRPGGLT